MKGFYQKGLYSEKLFIPYTFVAYPNGKKTIFVNYDPDYLSKSLLEIRENRNSFLEGILKNQILIFDFPEDMIRSFNDKVISKDYPFLAYIGMEMFLHCRNEYRKKYENKNKGKTS